MNMLRGLAMIMVLAVFVSGIVEAQNKYTGTKLCGTCHKSGKGGTSFVVWEKSAHANAFKTLLTEESKKIAAEKGIKGSPAEAEACLKCHVTGGGTAKNVEASFKKEDGVGCESCHGAASAYKMIHAKGELEKSKAAGLNPGEKTAKACQTCHNEESPTYKPFKFEEMWSKIAHPMPAAK